MFDFAASLLKTKLNSYRTSYAREHALVLKSLQAGDKQYKPKYEHYDRLEFLSTVVNPRLRRAVLCTENGSGATPNTDGTDGASLQDLEELSDFPVYNSPPGQDNDDDNDVDENLSCDLSCESIPDDKVMLRGLLEQNGSLSLRRREQNHDDMAFDDGSSSSHGLNPVNQPSTESRLQGADQELFMPLFHAQNKNARHQQQRNTQRQNGNQRSKKRRRSEDEAESDDGDLNFPKSSRQGVGEGEGGQVIHELVGYLVQRMNRREKRRSEKKARKGVGKDKSEDELWAKNLVHQIREITNEKKKQLLKLKISQMVIECRMEELE